MYDALFASQSHIVMLIDQNARFVYIEVRNIANIQLFTVAVLREMINSVSDQFTRNHPELPVSVF